MEINKINQLILSGGGVLGYSYIGVLKNLEELNIITNIKHIIGCSTGAIFGSLIALGYTSNELYTALIMINPSEYLNISLENIISFTKNKGLDNGELFINKLKELIGIKTLNPDITFIEMYEKTGIKLEIGITNINTMIFELCNYETTPNISIHLAIKASTAIPFIFQPVKISENWYCDGGLSNNYPINNMINENTTLGIYLTNSINIESIESIEDLSLGIYIDKIMKSCSNIISILKKYKNNTIIIEIPRDITTSFQFITNKENIAKCIVYGYQNMKTKMEQIQKKNIF